MDQAKDTMVVNQEIAAKLVDITPVNAEFLAAQDSFSVVTQIVPAPRMPHRMLQTIRLVSRQRRIEKEGERRLGFFQPDTSPVRCAKRDGDNLNLPGGKFILMQHNLGYMIPARNSTKMAQEDKVSGTAVSPKVAQGIRPCRHIRQHNVRR